VRKTALKFVKVINVGKQLADDEHSPAVGEDFRRSRHRTILAVTVHDQVYHAVEGCARK
jgi:hypothetical protein